MCLENLDYFITMEMYEYYYSFNSSTRFLITTNGFASLHYNNCFLIINYTVKNRVMLNLASRKDKHL